MTMPLSQPRPVDTLSLTVNGQPRDFFYRPDSPGDKGAIAQVFQRQDYALAPFPLAGKLQHYAEQQAKGGRVNLIVDAGANIGASVVYFHATFPGAAILAIEPEENNVELLRKNCAGLEGVEVFAGAFGGEAGRMFLHDPRHSDWGFRVSEAGGGTEVEVIGMQQILAEFPADRYAPFLCKIDIEGGEKYVFAKNTEWINKYPLIIIELHDWMLPGEANSKSFLKAITQYNFDFVYRGENVFCFNNNLLR